MSSRALVVVRLLDGTQYFVNDRDIAMAMMLHFATILKEKPKEDKPKEEKPREEKPKEEKPEEEKPKD
eukprot:808742-Heterocapsa_arctica.AAC.1